MKKIKTRQLHREQMYALVSKYKGTEQTQAEFCTEHQIKPATFHYWKRKQESQKEESANFLKLEVVSSEEKSHDIAVIRFPNGTVVEIPV